MRKSGIKRELGRRGHREPVCLEELGARGQEGLAEGLSFLLSVVESLWKILCRKVI